MRNFLFGSSEAFSLAHLRRSAHERVVEFGTLVNGVDDATRLHFCWHCALPVLR